MTTTGADLIGTTATAPGMAALAESWESFAYFHGAPYPRYAFSPSQWPDSKGPRPTPLPYVRTLVEEGADFLFRGGPPTFTVGDDPNAEGLISTIVRRNKLAARYIPLAVHVGNQGTLAAKFAYLPDDPLGPVRISFLSVPQECRIWVDPHDQSQVLMARIQYPYRSITDGKWYYFREEWTADLQVTYQPKPAGDSSVAHFMQLEGYAQTLGDGGDWQVEKKAENPFGLVPVTLIRNKQVEGSPLGAGDCWGAFRIIDRIALTMHGEDHSNQMHSKPIPVFANAVLGYAGEILPGEPVEVSNTNPQGPPADFKLVEPSGAAREYSFRSIDKWEELLYATVGLSRVDPATIGNKGNLTRLALMTAYARSVATSDRKRTSWGQDGLAVLFTNILLALERVGGVPEVRKVTEDTQVECQWEDYFDATDDDVKNLSDRTIAQNKAGILPRDRAAERVALAEGVPPSEMEDLKAELDAEKPFEPPTVPLADNGGNEDSLPTNAAAAESLDSSGVNNFSA